MPRWDIAVDFSQATKSLIKSQFQQYFYCFMPSALHSACHYTLSQKASDLRPSLADTSLFLQPQDLVPNLIYPFSCINPPKTKRVRVTIIWWDGRRKESTGPRTKSIADTSLFLQSQDLVPNLIYPFSCINPPLKNECGSQEYGEMEEGKSQQVQEPRM